MKTYTYQEAVALFNTPDKVYKIYNNIDLGGNTLNIPSGCTLDFQGCTLKNGTIHGNGTGITGIPMFENVTLTGTFAQFGPTTSRPTGSQIYLGYKYFDTTIHKLIFASAINGDTVTWLELLDENTFKLSGSSSSDRENSSEKTNFNGIGYYDRSIHKVIYYDTDLDKWVDALGQDVTFT